MMRITTQTINNTIIEILEKTEKCLLEGSVYRYMDKESYNKFPEDIKKSPSISMVEVIEGKQRQLLYELAFDKMKKLGLCLYVKEDILMFTEIYRITLEGYEFIEKFKKEEEVKINSGVRGQRENSRINFYDELAFKRKKSLG